MFIVLRHNEQNTMIRTSSFTRSSWDHMGFIVYSDCSEETSIGLFTMFRFAKYSIIIAMVTECDLIVVRNVFKLIYQLR